MIPGYQQLRQLKMDKPVYGIGLMSGTSVDAVDAALVRIHTNESPPLKIEAFIEHPIADALRERILSSMQPEHSHVDTICQLNFEIGEQFAGAALALIQSASIPQKQIAFIGSHGQTIYHIPKVDNSRNWHTPSTLQIGEPAIIAERTGIPTVADFRVRDMAAGGTGAPLIPFFDAFMFADDSQDILCQNLGGIANCTLITKDANITAFDSGPANMVMDALMRHFFVNKTHDKNGEISRKGTVNEDRLTELLQHSFFKLPPPKATGHEDFGDAFVKDFLQMTDWKPEDALATACELTAQSITNAYRDFIFPHARPMRVICSGGGTLNPHLMRRLRTRCPEMHWNTIDEFGISSTAKEAAGFSLLAFATLNRITSNVPSVTGARHDVTLGKIVTAI